MDRNASTHTCASRVRGGRLLRPSRASGSRPPRVRRPQSHRQRVRPPSPPPGSSPPHRKPRPNSLRLLATGPVHRKRYEPPQLRTRPTGTGMTSKDNFEFAHEHRREVAWMSQNTNTLPVHPSILDAIRASVADREFNLYPRKAGIFGLSDAIKEDLGLDDADMILTNGGIGGGRIPDRSLPEAGGEALSTDPAFLPVHDQVAMTGAHAIEGDLYREPYGLTPDLALVSITAA